MPALIDRHVSKKPNRAQCRVETPRVLCIDDDPDFQTAIDVRLRDYDVQVEHAYYGMQGIVESVNKTPDVILLDQAMPHGNGEYLLDVIKRNEATRDIPVIVMTGMRDPMLKGRLLQSGANVFLNKPVLFDELLHHISRFVDIRKKEHGEE